MPTLRTTAQRLGTATALALFLTPLPLLAQDQEADQDASSAQESTSSQDSSKQASSESIPLVPGTPTWDSFHGQLNAQKYSPLDQINSDNVGDLEKVWEVHTGDVSDGSGDLPPTVWSATPVFANDTLYIGTPFYRILALDPATGEQKWSFDTESTLEAMTQPALKSRGVAYWEADDPVEGESCQKIVYLGTMDAQLFAVDADTGEKCTSFADNGVLDVNQWNDTHDKWPLSLLQPPTVVGDHLILGWAGKDWAFEQAPPGTVFSINARTGEREWSFNALSDEMREKSGTANVWTHMSADEENGLVYLPISSPSPNYWGGNRTEDVPLATSTTALDVDTGEVVWSRQWVHHDVWDYDINAAPTLMDITVDGEEIPALIQATKQGFLFVVNRLTGEDVWPIEERPVPQGDGSVKGEEYADTQPFPTNPAPLLDQSEKPKIWKLADVVGGGECSALWDDLTYEGMYTPPTTQGEGALAYPDSAGGVQWGGVAFDPVSQTAIVNTSHIVQYVKLYEREAYEKADSGSGNESGFSPQTGSPYGMRLEVARNWLGMPCWEPPFGEVVALDMKTGDVKWRRPIGSSQQYGFFMPESWGSPTIGGPAVTAGNLVFIGASMDAKLRAYSLDSGEELWEDQAEAPAVANPAVYEYEGREYVAFVAGGNSILKDQVGDQVVVYALPEDEDE
ncbi:pyrroloquinoline quinone-dependent dehydrogenase [Chromohalobacter canadensis]|uniref:pyrroloquinoline quinone-dependent dehydrogenase n=1 Tax=Chromohalobacter canadensis TaxID=141389 RepID=UPI0021BFFEF2|nr:pyrroloquinoline quinone-dependent dehydrogenase [Chromohalobacter canadensis]MCT8468926.1 pyrroloquinoline quinone-dependent dehydrogenase [Chromohalobacter canadensis]MCT8472884.1 pyrroloquinoline quinone-dependent dehydrogenase [Chromohalobacter canadensis]MCT8500336.1 pyrroloquinoline quinone-dependent dehydrogenase [Chromohalobacter canadensis]